MEQIEFVLERLERGGLRWVSRERWGWSAFQVTGIVDEGTVFGIVMCGQCRWDDAGDFGIILLFGGLLGEIMELVFGLRDGDLYALQGMTFIVGNRIWLGSIIDNWI